jgi:hypothetical protein
VDRLVDAALWYEAINPIEKKWAQVKSIRRKLRCSIDELFSNHLRS